MRFAEQGKETRPRAASQYYCVEPGLSRLNMSWLPAKIRAFLGFRDYRPAAIRLATASIVRTGRAWPVASLQTIEKAKTSPDWVVA